MSETLKGVIGTLAPCVGIITSCQEQVLWNLRVASLVVGILVGVLTVVSLVRNWRRGR